MSENHCLVSVIIPVYNCERFIGLAIESVLNQTYSNIELLVIDDCSSDRTASVVRNYEKKDARVRLLQNACNQGVSNARNRGMDEAKGEYIAFLDSDDIWYDRKLEKQMVIAQETGADVIYCSYGFIDEVGKKVKRTFAVSEKTNYREMLYKNVIGASTAVLKKETAGMQRFSSEVQHEDYLMWMNILKFGGKAAGCSDELVSYRLVRGSRNASRRRSAVGRWRIYRDMLNMDVFESGCAFVKYMFFGIVKYYVYIPAGMKRK